MRDLLVEIDWVRSEADLFNRVLDSLANAASVNNRTFLRNNCRIGSTVFVEAVKPPAEATRNKGATP